MKTNIFMALVLLPTLVLTAAFAAPATAFADCSYNGFINSQGKCSVSWKPRPFAYPLYSYNTTSMELYIAYLRDLIETLQDQLDDRVNMQSDVNVTTKPATAVDTDSATLRGLIDLNNEDSAEVYFEYGRSRVEMDDDSKTLAIDDENDGSFSITVSGLREDTYYFFRAVAEDDDGDKDYGAILTFKTDDGGEDNDNDDPTLDISSPRNVTGDSAELRGSVDMNDFENGLVFFVYGEDEDLVSDIEDEYETFDDIDEEGDDLQVVNVDSDLDDAASYTKEVSGLDRDTDMYFSICVEYQDEDDDDVIRCSDTESFVTD